MKNTELNLAPYLMGHVVSNYVLKQLFDDRRVRCTFDFHVHLVEIQRQTRSVTGIIKSPVSTQTSLQNGAAQWPFLLFPRITA